jgi:hypothetical protein
MVNIINTKDFYPIMKSWFREHNFPILDEDFLSTITMVRYTKENQPSHCISVYHTSSKLCWIGFPLSNPYINKEEKEGGIEELLQEVEIVAKGFGYKYIFTTSMDKKLQDKFSNSGFSVGDEGVNHYIKII